MLITGGTRCPQYARYVGVGSSSRLTMRSLTRLLSWSMNRMGRYCTVFPSWILGAEPSPGHWGAPAPGGTEAPRCWVYLTDRSPNRNSSGFWLLAGPGRAFPQGVEGPVRHIPPSQPPLENAVRLGTGRSTGRHSGHRTRGRACAHTRVRGAARRAGHRLGRGRAGASRPAALTLPTTHTPSIKK